MEKDNESIQIDLDRGNYVEDNGNHATYAVSLCIWLGEYLPVVPLVEPC